MDIPECFAGATPFIRRFKLSCEGLTAHMEVFPCKDVKALQIGKPCVKEACSFREQLWPMLIQIFDPKHPAGVVPSRVRNISLHHISCSALYIVQCALYIGQCILCSVCQCMFCSECCAV